ncbi:MAG TPA: hypothetical protein ENJ33_07625 [Thiothrix sp.]|nr:hypothetical protein [Thiothrix sp.]
MKRIVSVLLLFLTLVLLISISFTLTEKIVKKAEKKAAKQLLLTLSIRKEDIETYYRTVQLEVLFWAKNRSIIKHLQQKNNRTIQLLNNLSTERGYDNIVLTTPQGKIIHSTNEHISLLPAYLQPLLSQVQQEKGVFFSDYITTDSSPSEQHAFVAAGIFNQQALLGILLVQLSNQPLRKLTKPLSGTHNNIQTLVIGHDKQLRNQITTMPHKIQLPSLTDNLLAYGNKQVLTLFDQRNKPFLAAFDFAHVSKNLTWVIITKTDINEVRKPIKKQINKWIMLGISLLISSLIVGYLGERWIRNRKKENV